MRGHLNHSVVYNHVAAARTVEKSTGMEMKSGSGNTNQNKLESRVRGNSLARFGGAASLGTIVSILPHG